MYRLRYPATFSLLLAALLTLPGCGKDEAEKEEDPPYSQKVMRDRLTAEVLHPGGEEQETKRGDTAVADAGAPENEEDFLDFGDDLLDDEDDMPAAEEDDMPKAEEDDESESDGSTNGSEQDEPAPSAADDESKPTEKPAEDQNEDEVEDGAAATGGVIQPRHKALLAGLTIFVLAIFVGFEVITKVPPTLHTPLMSGSNAISGITLVGAVTVTGVGVAFSAFTGFIAIILATINVVGGFLVTHRMLSMFKKR